MNEQSNQDQNNELPKADHSRFADIFGDGSDNWEQPTDDVSLESALKANKLSTTHNEVVEVYDTELGWVKEEITVENEAEETTDEPETVEVTFADGDTAEINYQGTTITLIATHGNSGGIDIDVYGGEQDDLHLWNFDVDDIGDMFTISLNKALLDRAKKFQKMLTDQQDDLLNEVVTTKEISETFGISDAAVRQAILDGNLPARKSGNTWLVLRSDADARWSKVKEQHPNGVITVKETHIDGSVTLATIRPDGTGYGQDYHDGKAVSDIFDLNQDEVEAYKEGE